MSRRFRNAIVRPPGRSFANGLTTASLGLPDLSLALDQHAAYCRALESCGVAVTVLPASQEFADAPFVEDTAIVSDGRALTTIPGAPSRTGEVASVREALAAFFDGVDALEAPATLDGGDVCEGDDRVFVGISHRTNAAGVRQLARWLARTGRRTATVDIRDLDSILHLKSGMAYIGDGRYAVAGVLRPRLELHDRHIVRVEPEESYAANCVRVNDAVLVPDGFPGLARRLEALGYATIALDVSEFRKLDGGLSCLSLRF